MSTERKKNKRDGIRIAELGRYCKQQYRLLKETKMQEILAMVKERNGWVPPSAPKMSNKKYMVLLVVDTI